jgi:predicted phage terminase large subunit-like protein
VSFLAAAADLLEAEADAPWLREIRDWRDSSCTDPDPANWPSRELAVNWDRVNRLCTDPEHVPYGCRMCHSCSTCRPEQRTPLGDWDVTQYLAGRGAGKTRSAAEDMAAAGVLNSNWRMAILAPTFADARDTCVEGESGLESVLLRMGVEYQWNRSIGELIIPMTGSRYKLFSAEKPARLRGPQHHRAWVDELAQVAKRAVDAWEMLLFGMRLGRHPQIITTTTPLPLSVIKELLADPHCVTRRGTTDSNRANLPASTLRALHAKFDGTAKGRQELDGDILEEVEGALWKQAQIDADRCPELPRTWVDSAGTVHEFALVKIVLAIDPAVEGRKTDDEHKPRRGRQDPDETGIVVAGLGSDGKIYILGDYSMRDTPAKWSQEIIRVYELWNCNEAVIEVNNGGQALVDLIRETEKWHGGDLPLVIHKIRAKQGKRVRAEPVSALCEQHRVRFVGTFKGLEDQLVTWTTDETESPDRLDAFVYAVLRLAKGGVPQPPRRAQGAIQRHQIMTSGLRHAMPGRR